MTTASAALPLVEPATDAAAAAARAVDEDAALVARAQAGDRAAFAALYRKHHGRIYAMCARLLARGTGSYRAEVEDALQHTFLEAWRCLHRFEGKSRFTTWLTRIAIHTCFSTRRRLKRLLLSEDDTGEREQQESAKAPVWAEPAITADEVSSRRARERALLEVLGRLSEKKRSVFVLADLEGMSSTEIASVLDIPDATVRTRLFHARKELAGLLRDHPGFADVAWPTATTGSATTGSAGGER